MITASQFAKRYAFLSAVPVLYTLSAFDKGLELPLDRTTLELPADGQGAAPTGLRVAGLRVTAPAPGKRAPWRSELIGRLFAGHLTPIWRALSATSSIPAAILWENAAVRLFSLYEKRLRERGGPQERVRMRDDFAFLVGEAPGSLFGEKTNPLTRFYRPADPHVLPTQPVRLRKTCCLYYKVADDGGDCEACPKAQPPA